jgi:hypothetical protein
VHLILPSGGDSLNGSGVVHLGNWSSYIIWKVCLITIPRVWKAHRSYGNGDLKSGRDEYAL